MNSALPYAAANAVLKEFAMKKTLGIAAAALVAGASLFAEGLSVNGYIRSGISIDPKGETVKTDTWLPGDYFGGGSRLRLNINYDGVNGGATFRYQKSGSFGAKDWFEADNIKWAMGYAKFLDGKIIAEAGKLVDSVSTLQLRREKSLQKQENLLTPILQQADGKTVHSVTVKVQESVHAL